MFLVIIPSGGGEASISRGRSSIARCSPGTGHAVGTFLKMRALFWTILELIGREGMGLVGVTDEM